MAPYTWPHLFSLLQVASDCSFELYLKLRYVLANSLIHISVFSYSSENSMAMKANFQISSLSYILMSSLQMHVPLTTEFVATATIWYTLVGKKKCTSCSGKSFWNSGLWLWLHALLPQLTHPGCYSSYLFMIYCEGWGGGGKVVLQILLKTWWSQTTGVKALFITLQHPRTSLSLVFCRVEIHALHVVHTVYTVRSWNPYTWWL